MNFYQRIMRAILTKYASILYVVLAFTLMVFSSYLFVSNTEKKHLRGNADNAIRYTEANIKSDMLEPETLLGGVAETIASKIIQGESAEEINEFIAFFNNYVNENKDKRLLGVMGFFGVFDVFDGIMLLGEDEWTPHESYDFTDRPWFRKAVEADGEIVMTEPYFNYYSREMTITLSRRIFDDERNPLGVICTNIELNRIAQHAVNTKFAENGYGFLLSEDGIIIAHPNPSMIGLSYINVNSGIVDYVDEFNRVGNINEITTQDYRGIESIVFVEKLYNGWYMGVVTPRNNYFKGTKDLAVILIILGIIFAGLLIWMLLRISAEKAKVDERMQIMFNSTPLGSILWNKDYRVIDCNANTLNIFGIPDKDEFARRFFDLMPRYQPNGLLSRKRGIEYVEETVDKGAVTFEWMHQKLDGEELPTEVTLIRVKYNNDFIVVGYIRDLRDHKKMLKTIEKRTHLLDTVNSTATILLSSSSEESFEPSLLKSFDLLGRCLDVDRVQIWCNEILDGDLHFVLRYEWLSDYGKGCRHIPKGLHFPYHMKKEWEELFSRGEYINSPVAKLSKEDQAFLGYYDIKSIVFIPMFLEGNFWGLFSIDDCRNERAISEEEVSILSSAGLMMSSAVNRNMQTAKMRETEQRTQLMFDAAPLGICFIDSNSTVIDCNREILNLFELKTKNEFITRFFELSTECQPDGTSSREKAAQYFKKTLEDGFCRFEWMHQKFNGEAIPAEIILMRVRHKGEYTVTGYIRDLREEHAMLREMRKAEIAEESSKAKSNFLARMSHEIRTPMNAILGITEIQMQEQNHNSSTREAFERIYSSSNLLLGIINDILDLSKIEAGRLELVPVQYDIASLINDTVQLNIMRYESKPIEFILDVNENLPLIFLGDELRIKQILNNILSNAFKYTDEGMVNLTISSEPINDKSEVILVFSVTDTGQGMTPDQVQKLGGEYARFNMEANRKTEGTGLGMNITMSLLNIMNGTISIDSTPGMGSTFLIKIPQKCIDPDPIGKELAENLMQLNLNNVSKIRSVQVKRDYMPYGSVLVVDDVETNLYVAKGLMAPYGLTIDTVSSGFEAIEKIRDGEVYDIIFMDHMMPKMDGIEAAKIIRSMGYSNSIVALTANALSGQVDVFLSSGFDDFISKPIDLRQLNSILNKLIRDKQSPETLEEARKQKDNAASFYNEVSINAQLAEIFIRDAKKAISVLEKIYMNKCRKPDDIPAFIINIHSMKSALANIGETDLSYTASKLEQAGRDKDVMSILAELPLFLERLYSIINKLEEIKDISQQEDASAEETEEDIQFFKERLIAIKASCSSYDKKTAKEDIAKLKEKRFSPERKQIVNKIIELLLHSDFDEIIKIIDEYVG